MPGFKGARNSTGDRGYGNPHQRARRAAFAALPEWSSCARCSSPLWKWQTEKPDSLGRTRSALHYDHDEDGGYLGFSHNTCNREAGAAKGGRVVAARNHNPEAVRNCSECARLFHPWSPAQRRCNRCRYNWGNRLLSAPVPPTTRPYRCEVCGTTCEQTGSGRPRKVCTSRLCLQERQRRLSGRDHGRRTPLPRWQSRLW